MKLLVVKKGGFSRCALSQHIAMCELCWADRSDQAPQRQRLRIQTNTVFTLNCQNDGACKDTTLTSLQRDSGGFFAIIFHELQASFSFRCHYRTHGLYLCVCVFTESNSASNLGLLMSHHSFLSMSLEPLCTQSIIGNI